MLSVTNMTAAAGCSASGAYTVFIIIMLFHRNFSCLYIIAICTFCILKSLLSTGGFCFGDPFAHLMTDCWNYLLCSYSLTANRTLYSGGCSVLCTGRSNCRKLFFCMRKLLALYRCTADFITASVTVDYFFIICRLSTGCNYFVFNNYRIGSMRKGCSVYRCTADFGTTYITINNIFIVCRYLTGCCYFIFLNCFLGCMSLCRVCFGGCKDIAAN